MFFKTDKCVSVVDKKIIYDTENLDVGMDCRVKEKKTHNGIVLSFGR